MPTTLNWWNNDFSKRFMDYNICWAKTTAEGEPGISVRDHCLNVGCVAEAMLKLLPPHVRKLVPQGAATLASLHDIGKISPGFQVKCPVWLSQQGFLEQALCEGWSIRESDHAKISQAAMQGLFNESRFYRWAAILGAHHGRIKGERVFLREPWEEERCAQMIELINEFGGLPDQPPEEAVLWFVAGLTTVADWIGSDEKHFPQDAKWEMSERRSQAHNALEDTGWRSLPIRKNLGFGDLFSCIPQANSLQTTTLQAVHEPGTYLIEGPMGYGKTEAALAAIYKLIADGKAAGFYFALPTQVTSNRIHLRVQPFVDAICNETTQVRLAHSASWLLDYSPPLQFNAGSKDNEEQTHIREGRSWFASSKRALLAPFGVGTIDQALLGVVAAKHFFVRQFGLAGKVVVLDEVHTYDLYTSTLVDTLVKQLRRLQCTVIILSATLTQKRRKELLGIDENQPLSTAYPLISGKAGTLVELPCDPPPAKTIHIRSVSNHGLVEQCLERAQKSQCVLWIRNTVDEAQETYRALKNVNFEGGPEIALLHSRFPFFRREELESTWMERLGRETTDRPHGCVLVSTQVAEQSVDIDADLLITDLAPTDMLLQRLGRLWRHERQRNEEWRPEVWIQMPVLSDAEIRTASEKQLRETLGKSAWVYAPYVLLRSLQQWRERKTITLPTEIRPILEATYADPAPDEPEGWQRLREELEKKKQKMAASALTAAAVWVNPALQDEEGVQTRYAESSKAQLLLLRKIERLDGHSVKIYLLNGDNVVAHDYHWDIDTAKAIHRNLVYVPYWTVASMLENQPWLINHTYQRTAVGLFQEADSTLRGLDGRTSLGLSYHENQGIIINHDQIKRTKEETDEYFD